VQQLHVLSDSQQLPGTFYGRLCSVAAVKDTGAAVAVNAALQEVCSLRSMMIVSDRLTAVHVIGHFRMHRVGTVQCKILSELQRTKQAAEATSFSTNAGSKPLLRCVSVGDKSIGGLPELLQQLLGNWLLVENCEAARKQQHLKRNMVTR
jgi:chromosome segregation ATPase